MRAKPAVPRDAARQDIEAAIDHYGAEGGEALALRFLGALEAAFWRIGQQPGIGSPRLAFELGLDGLRAWPLRRFPHLLFYREEPAHLDVWRVLHAHRDIPAWLHP